MPLELAGVAIDKLVSIEVSEGARFVRHAVPGQEGDYAQALGRPSVQIRVQGIFLGDTAADDLKTLRGHLLDRQPIDFLCDITGQGYFSQVLVDRLEVGQRAGRLDEFDFDCTLVEYVPPPPAPAADAFGDIDTGLVDEATSMMDDAQNALSQVAGLTGLLSGGTDFGNPTTKLPSLLDAFSGATAGSGSTLSGLGDLL